MNVSSAGTSISWPASKSVGTNVAAAARNASGSSSADVAGDFLKYAKMSPMERMRANILKEMDLTEEQLGALPQEQKQKIEAKIKESIMKMVSESGQKGQLVDVSA